jgi:hypothetical protein
MLQAGESPRFSSNGSAATLQGDCSSILWHNWKESRVPYLIGTDEAGYGPNLGPLVITATAWDVLPGSGPTDLYHRLSAAIVNAPCASEWGKLPLAIADSKALYRPPHGLAQLERGVLCCLRTMGTAAACWRELWDQVEPARDTRVDLLPWHVDCEVPLPCAADGEELAVLADVLRSVFESNGVRLVRIACRCLFPAEFNALTDRYGNKAEALSRTTLQLVADLLASLPPAQTFIVCDKHGGRNRYGPMLQRLFPDVLIEVAHESRGASTYRWGPKPTRCVIDFLAGGERAMPTALASMVSKYLRELSMLAFNDYWRRHLPELRPTAGYPSDSHRFRAEISVLQQSLGIEDRLLWRQR